MTRGRGGERAENFQDLGKSFNQLCPCCLTFPVISVGSFPADVMPLWSESSSDTSFSPSGEVTCECTWGSAAVPSMQRSRLRVSELRTGISWFPWHLTALNHACLDTELYLNRKCFKEIWLYLLFYLERFRILKYLHPAYCVSDTYEA